MDSLYRNHDKVLKALLVKEIQHVEAHLCKDEIIEKHSVSYLLRYGFLNRLVNSLNRLPLNEDLFYREYTSNHGHKTAHKEASVIYDKYFSKRMKMSYKDFLSKRSEKFYQISIEEDSDALPF